MKEWKQPHTDKTLRRQTLIVNVVMGFLAKNDKFKTICLMVLLICEHGTAKCQSKSIIAAFT